MRDVYLCYTGSHRSIMHTRRLNAVYVPSNYVMSDSKAVSSTNALRPRQMRTIRTSPRPLNVVRTSTRSRPVMSHQSQSTTPMLRSSSRRCHRLFSSGRRRTTIRLRSVALRDALVSVRFCHSWSLTHFIQWLGSSRLARQS